MFRYLNPKMKAGFTLIEILVVITVIGILLAAGGAAFVNVQRSARDAERLREITAIQDAFEQYYAANGNYAPAGTGDTYSDLSSVFSSSGNVLSEYFPAGTVPSAPGGAAMQYTFVNNSTGGAAATAYCVCGTLEQKTRANATGSDANTGACTVTQVNPTMFCLSNKQ